MIFKRDARPVFRQVLSGLKMSAVIIASGAGILICSSFVPVHRIEAFFWHLRHGTSVVVGDYRFPAPNGWYIENLSQNDVVMFDLQSGDSIDVKHVQRPKQLTLAAWSDLTSKPTADMKVTARRELHIGNEKILCLEEDFDMKKAHIYPISCRSEGALEVSFTPFLASGKSRDEAFYLLLQQTVIER